jgi:predicted CoA-binding protein
MESRIMETSLGDVHQDIEAFLAGDRFAVVGASRNRDKYGNKVLRVYMQNDLEVSPVHPKEEEIEGLRCYRDVASVPGNVHGVSVITPPAVTEKVVEDTARAGVKHIWMQPGAESPEAIRRAKELGLSVIAGGPCILVSLGYKE